MVTRPSGGRRRPRPTHVLPCPTCGDLSSFNYRTCPTCYTAVEQFWIADWEALLAQEGIVTPSPHPLWANYTVTPDQLSPDELLLAQVVLEEQDNHPWTVVDIAMRLVPCPECGAESGGTTATCDECKQRHGVLWWYDHEAGMQAQMTMNEHALRVGRYILRYPDQYSTFIAEGWRTNYPRMLTGWLATTAQAQAWAKLAREGKHAELDAIMRQIDEMINAKAERTHT